MSPLELAGVRRRYNKEVFGNQLPSEYSPVIWNPRLTSTGGRCRCLTDTMCAA